MEQNNAKGYIGLVMVHGKIHYVESRLGTLTSKRSKALVFETQHEACLHSERSGGAADCEPV